MKVCIIGTGYVGLVTGACLSFLGHDVTCVDSDQRKVALLRSGRSPIYEPGLEELIAKGRQSDCLRFTTNLNERLVSADVVFIAVGTPPGPDGSSDLSQVKAAAQGIGRALIQGAASGQFKVIVNKSTVPVGSGNWVEMLIREQLRSLVQVPVSHANGNGSKSTAKLHSNFSYPETEFAVVSNPEFLREGSAISDTLYPDRIVIGFTDERARRMLEDLYRPILDQSFDAPSIARRPRSFAAVPLVATDLASAEMIKYAANAFLALKISFANEMANICERTGADVTKVMHGIGLDRRIGKEFLNAGVGWGGSCFGKDVSALTQIAGEYGYAPDLLGAAVSVNRRQRRLVIQKLQSELKIIKGRTIGLLGLSFKPDTDDVRDAPSFDIASELMRMGARVKAYDPVAMDAFSEQHPHLEITYCLSLEDLAADCDAVVVVTEWKEFRNARPSDIGRTMRGSLLIDGRNVFDPGEAAECGLRYVGIGR